MLFAVDWTLFLPAIILLLFPADQMLPARVKLRSLGHFPLYRKTNRRPWWWVAALWIDPLRGFGGSWLLVRALGLDTPWWSQMPKTGFGVLLGVLAFAAISQIFTRRDPRVILAPVGFVCGASIGLLPGFAPFVGLATALIGMFAFRQFYAFFAIGLLVLPPLGLLFGAPPALLGASLLLFLLPLITGRVTNFAMEIPTHAGNQS